MIAGWAVVFGPVELDTWFDEPGFARTLGVLATAKPLQPSAELGRLRSLPTGGC